MNPEATALPVVHGLLREIVGPELAASVIDDQERPLLDRISHADLALLFHLVQRLRPDLAAAAFWDPSTSAATVEHWLANATGAGASPDIIRGEYRTGRVVLREITPSDLDQLYRMAMDPSQAHRWRYQGRSLSPEDFRATVFSRAVLCQFAVVSASGQLAGCVTAYDADFLGGHCAIAAMGGGHHDAGKGALAEGCGVLLEYVFDHFPMHKVFLEMPEYNARLLGGSMEGIAALEGEISDYYFFAGRRWSKQIYSISREHWASVVSDHLPSWDHS